MSEADPKPLEQMTYDVLPERLGTIPPEQMTEAQKKIAAGLAESRGSVRGPFAALMRRPELVDRLQNLGKYARFEVELDPRINRMAGMMMTRHWSNQYEWSGHLPFAAKAGLSQEIVDAIGEGRRPRGMAEDEEVIHDFMAELLTYKSVSDPTYARAIGKFGEEGVIDILAVVGYYAFNAMVMNVMRTPVPGGKPFQLAPMPQQMRPKI